MLFNILVFLLLENIFILQISNSTNDDKYIPKFGHILKYQLCNLEKNL